MILFFFWLERTGNVSQHFSLSQEAKKADVFVHTSTHWRALAHFCWLEYTVCLREVRCSACESDRTILQYSLLRGECGVGADRHTHTHTYPLRMATAVFQVRRWWHGSLAVRTLPDILGILTSFALGDACVCVCVLQRVCLLVLCENSECSQTCWRKSSECKTCVFCRRTH